MSVSVLVLRQFPQFSDWPDAALLELSEKLELRRLTRRQVVLTDQDIGTTLAWVVEGTTWLVDHSLDDRECVLGRYGPGELLGELHAFGGSRDLPSGLGYMAAGAASIATISKVALMELINTNPLIAQGVIRLLAERSCALFLVDMLPCQHQYFALAHRGRKRKPDDWGDPWICPAVAFCVDCARVFRCSE